MYKTQVILPTHETLAATCILPCVSQPACFHTCMQPVGHLHDTASITGGPLHHIPFAALCSCATAGVVSCNRDVIRCSACDTCSVMKVPYLQDGACCIWPRSSTCSVLPCQQGGIMAPLARLLLPHIRMKASRLSHTSLCRYGPGVCMCRMRPGLAMSQDGLNWARIEGEHHTGALLDVGEEGDWDELFIANPQAGCLACLVLEISSLSTNLV